MLLFSIIFFENSICYYDVVFFFLRVIYLKLFLYGKDIYVLYFLDDFIILKFDCLIMYKDNNMVNNIFFNFCIIILFIKFVIVKIIKCFLKIKIRIIYNIKYINF